MKRRKGVEQRRRKTINRNISLRVLKERILDARKNGLSIDIEAELDRIMGKDR